jgi:uncharacterized protein (UPF0297 family)
MQQSLAFNVDDNENLELAEEFKQIYDKLKNKTEARTDSL